MLTKVCAAAICLVLVLLSVLGCTPENPERSEHSGQNGSLQTEGPASTAAKDAPDTDGAIPDSETALPEGTDTDVVWTPFV